MLRLLYPTLAFVTGVAIAYLLQQYVDIYSHITEVTVTKPVYKLAVGVLSAREHFEQRQVIRETWTVPFRKEGSSRTRIWFVLGDKDCDIHPNYREDPYSCVQWNPTLPENFENAEVVDFQKLSSLESKTPLKYRQFRHKIHFKVLHPIVIKRFGLLLSIPLDKTTAHVSLYDQVTEEVFVKTSFSAKDPGIVSTYMRYQTVESYSLPKGFEGCIFVNLTTEDASILPVDLEFRTSLNNVSGIIKIWEKEKSLLVKEETSVHLVSFVVQIQEKPELQQLVRQQTALQNDWIKQKNEIRKLLELESQNYQDVVFLNVTEVYRNLPRKLLLFHEWLYSNTLADFVMKTDDDCFVNLEKILSILDTVKTKPHKMWWGSFRDQWLVERSGKWTEPDYTADVYPRFACGVGNVVSRDVHSWIARNSHNLHTYQGEDVSMGIWLSAIRPTYIQDDQWLCSPGCLSTMYASPELSTQEIRLMWTSYEQCNNLCGCYK